MVGITSYGAYVPHTRLPLTALSGRKPKQGDPEKAVAWHDEDALTMAAQQAAERHSPVAATMSPAAASKLRALGLDPKYANISNESELREMKAAEAEKKK